jgi:hypothetical protein
MGVYYNLMGILRFALHWSSSAEKRSHVTDNSESWAGLLQCPADN